MEKFIDKELTSITTEPKITKMADNVKIVTIPGQGVIYVCPYPPSHFDALVEEARTVEPEELRK
jgi:hypothetical protein